MSSNSDLISINEEEQVSHPMEETAKPIATDSIGEASSKDMVSGTENDSIEDSTVSVNPEAGKVVTEEKEDEISGTQIDKDEKFDSQLESEAKIEAQEVKDGVFDTQSEKDEQESDEISDAQLEKNEKNNGEVEKVELEKDKDEEPEKSGAEVTGASSSLVSESGPTAPVVGIEEEVEKGENKEETEDLKGEIDDSQIEKSEKLEGMIEEIQSDNLDKNVSPPVGDSINNGVVDSDSNPVEFQNNGVSERDLSKIAAQNQEIETETESEMVKTKKEGEKEGEGGEEKLSVNDEFIRDDDELEEDLEGLDAKLARVAILDSTETAKEIMKQMDEGPSSIDGQIVLDSSDEEDDDEYEVEEEDGEIEGEEREEREVFDSAALAALLKAAAGGDSNITITPSEGSGGSGRVFTIDRPAGLPALRPASGSSSGRPAGRSSGSLLFSGSQLSAVPTEPEEMTEEERKLHEKVEQIRVKFLRLVYRSGHSPEDTVAAQVLYRLGLAEGIRRGRQAGARAFSLESARKNALQLESEGKDDLNFSCNILVLGKLGVGKSATINSIFNRDVSVTNPFRPATGTVHEIAGTIDGICFRVIDTPGLKTSVMDQSYNRKVLESIKRCLKKCPPDIVLYVDRMDTQTRDLNDLPLLRTITSTLGSSIWFNAIVALTHAASAPPDGPNGSPLTYEVFVAQRSHVVQQAIRQAAGDMRLMNPVALVENHQSCRRNKDGHKVLPNGLSWRQELLLLCYSSKILSEANALLKLQDGNSNSASAASKLFGFRIRSPPLPFLLSSLLQSRAHPKLATDQGGDINGDSDVDMYDLSDSDQEEEEDEYDSLPPFKPLKKSQIEKLTKEQKRAYLEEYDYRVKLLQKKQWKEEVRRVREMKRREKENPNPEGSSYAVPGDEYDQDNVPASVPVPLPDMVLPPSFDCDLPTYRYRFLEPSSGFLARPVLDTHGWDHDCGYDGVSLEENLALLDRFPANMSVQITKDKKEFSIHLESSVSAKHGETGSSLAGFDIQTVGRQLGYILRGETKFKNFKKNKTTGGISVTFLGDVVATGLKLEDQINIGKRITLVASTGGVRAQGDTALGANLEARLRDKDYPIGQALSTLGLSLMRWRGDLALGANLQSQFSVGRASKIALRVGLNNKLSGQVTVRTSTSDQLQIALLGIIPMAVSIFRSVRSGGESVGY